MARGSLVQETQRYADAHISAMTRQPIGPRRAIGCGVSLHDLPAWADVPVPGEHIDKGKPILTLLARAETEAACLDALRQSVQDLDQWLFGR